MIGDTAFDMAMARAAGCRALGVAWGYHAAEELIAAGAEAVAHTPAELEELIDG
jgi:phosphoglycolate phosphatase